MSDDHQEFISFEAPELEELENLLNGYQFESFIAQGGMGAVYLARQTSLDRQVAVKVLPREFGEDEEFRESFQSEAKLMAKLNHPNLIGIYDFGDIDGMLYIIMEYVKGKSLHHSAHGKAILQETAVEIISGVCSGLDHAHESGILHRDVKPANILLNKKAVPKIGDFGLARPSGMTESGVIYGTPGYSAPEVLDAPEKVDNRTDVFAVGVMFYELLTGQLPDDEYESVTNFADCDARFDKIIQKATHADIEHRHSSAKEFASEVNAILENPVAKNRLLARGASGSDASSKSGGEKGEQKGVAPAPVTHSVPSDSKLMRNIVIIILLLGAIYAVLEMKKVREVEVAELEKADAEKIALKNREKEERNAAIAEERRRDAAAREAERNPKSSNGSGSDTVTPPPELVKLPPLEKLKKIKELLGNGERPMAMMPETIFMRDQNSRIVMYIDKKMTWDEADVWAREYGGYIAVCKSKSDLTVLMKQIPADAGDVWLGAGTSGDKGWSWIDDTPWSDSTLTLKSNYNRVFAKMSKYGSVGKSDSNKKLNFFIEWRADGSNPADLEYRLLRTSDTLTDINPKYPPGAITAGARNYCLIKSPVTYREASELAIASGGHLLVISSDDEKYEVEGFVGKYCKSGETIWTAAEKQNNIWGWQTGEKWLNLKWVPSHPQSEKNVVIKAAKELEIMDVSAGIKADGFIIEWSKDKSKVKMTGLNSNDNSSGGGLSALKSKARKLISKQRAATEKKHARNVKKLWSDLETYMRGLPKNARLAESVVINKIIEVVKDKPRVPVKLAGEGPSERSRDYTNYAVEKQARIDRDHDEKIEQLRNGYIKQLQKIKKEMEKKGQISAVKLITQEAKNIGTSSEDFENSFK